MSKRKTILIYAVLLFSLQLSLYSQDDSETSVDLEFSLGIGAVSLDGTVYNTINLNPELSIGKFGLALDVDLRFTFSGDDGDTTFSIYEPDWYLSDGDFLDYLNLYLSKFDYIRWGESGDDLYAQLGSIESATVGNGFIVGGYTNESYKPDTKYTGFRFELDTSLFDFPYMGVEILVSNISAFDLIAARIYAKPLGGIESPVFSGLETGFTFAVDRDPYFFLDDDDSNGIYDIADSGEAFEDYSSLFVTSDDPEPVVVYGVDVIQPLLDIKIFTMAIYGDYVLQGLSDPTMGGSAGLSGTLIKLITWNGGLIFRGDDFVPNYFDRTYDLDRSTNYILYQNDHSTPIQEAGIDYKTSLGFSFLSGGISFVAQVTGPFDAPTEDALDAPWEYPHLMALFSISEGIIPYFDVSFWYDKQGIDSLDSLVDPTNALIGGRVNYTIQAAVLSLQVDVKYDTGAPDDWDVTTTLETAIQF